MNTERPNDALIAKIRKILEKTESAGCTEAEAASAFALASRLMAEHNLDMADIAVKDGEPAVEWAEDAVFETGQWKQEYNITWNIVHEHFFVEGWFAQRNGKKVLMLFGKKENLEAARFVFQGLIAAYPALWTTYRFTNNAPASDRRVFIVGVAEGFKSKLADERRAMEVERDLLKGRTGGTALALVSVKQETNAQYAIAHPRNAKRGYGKGHYASLKGSQSTLEAGIAAGRRLDLNRSIGGAGQKRIGV